MEEQKSPTPPNPVHTPGTDKGEEKTRTDGKEPGRHDTGTTGQANRPSGKTTARDVTGVNPDNENPVDPASPNIPAP